MDGGWEIETHVVEVNGTQLAYDTAGHGYPLVLVHGGLGDRRMWDDQMDVFAQHYRVIRYDQRGYGESSTAAGPVAFHKELYGFLRALDIARAHVIGLSFGARVATDFTLSHPDIVSALVSVSSVVGGISDATMEQIEEAEQAGEESDLDRAVELKLRLWIDGVGRGPEEVTPQVREQVRIMNRAVWERVTTDVEIVELAPPARDRLAEIRVPILIVVGDLDVPDVHATAHLLQREIQGAQLVTIPRAAHHPHMEQPALFNRGVLEFLARLDGLPQKVTP